MGRLFWKFFLSILLAQVVAAVGIGGAIWLRNRDANTPRQQDIDTGPRAEDAIESAAATLEFGGVNALQSLLENMNRHRVYAVNEQGRELLGRIVKPAMILEARRLLKLDGSQRVVREVKAADGHRYVLFLPSRENLGGMQGGGGTPLLRSLASIASVPLDGGHPPYPRNHGDWRGPGPGPAAVPGTGTGTSTGTGYGYGAGPASPDRAAEPQGPGMDRRAPPGPCLLYTSPSPRDGLLSRMPSSA